MAAPIEALIQHIKMERGSNGLGEDEPRKIAKRRNHERDERHERMKGTKMPSEGLRGHAQVRFKQRLQFVRKLFRFSFEASADVKRFSFDQEILVVEYSVGEVEANAFEGG